MMISVEYPRSHTSSPSIRSILLSTQHPPLLGEALQVCCLALHAPALVLRGMFACSPCSVRSRRGLSEAVPLLCLATPQLLVTTWAVGPREHENSKMGGVGGHSPFLSVPEEKAGQNSGVYLFRFIPFLRNWNCI